MRKQVPEVSIQILGQQSHCNWHLWLTDSSQGTQIIRRFNRTTHLQITGGVQEQVRRFQVAMEHVRRVDVLETSKNLVEEVADVVVA